VFIISPILFCAGEEMRRFVPVLALILVFAAELNLWGMTVDLHFQPTAPSVPSSALLVTVKGLRPVNVLPFSDLREARDTYMGEIRMTDQVMKIQSTVPVAAFAGEVFKMVYDAWGGKMSPDGPLGLKGEVSHFVIEDVDTGQARIGIHFYLTDESGRIIWDGHSSGIAKGGGRTMDPETLTAIFSDLLLATYTELLNDEKLVGVWSGKVSNTYVIRDNAATTAAGQKK
jgi:hypothetical protein